MVRAEYRVNGMTRGHRAAAIRAEGGKLDGVDEVTVDLAGYTATPR